MHKRQSSPASPLHQPQPDATPMAAVGSPAQQAMAGMAGSVGAGMEMARGIAGVFADATAGGGDPLPFQAELEAALGMDLSFITAHTGEDDALASLGAEGASYGEHIVLRSTPTLETTAEEVLHSLQSGPRSGETGALSSPGDPAEHEASSLAHDIAAGGSIGALPQAPIRDAIHRSLDPRLRNLPEPTDMDFILDAGPLEKASLLDIAFIMEDMATIYITLAGDNRAVKGAYQGLHGGETVEERIKISLAGSDQVHALAFARYGKADISSRILAVTCDIMGTDEDLLFALLEGATIEERHTIANDSTLMRHIIKDTSGTTRARCLAALEPLRGTGGLPEAQRQALFEQITAQEASLSGGAEVLLTRLEARAFWWMENTEGVIKDITAWATQHGPIPDLDAETGEPASLADVFAWMQRTLSADDRVRATAILRNGGSQDTLDKIEAADAIWHDWSTRSDEEAIFTSLAECTPAERAQILADEAQLDSIMARLSTKDQQRAMTLLQSTTEGEESAAFNDLLAVLDGWLYVDDTKLFAALEKLSTDELARIRDDDELRSRIARGTARKTRLYAIIGYTGADAEEALTGEQLAADNARLVARIEYACASLDNDEDLIYRAVMEWQAAGGVMGEEDTAHVNEIAFQLRGYQSLRQQVQEALRGERQLTQLGRLENAAAPRLWTDDAGLEATLADVSDEELVRTWSNLDEHKALADQVQSEEQLAELAAFQVDISSHVLGLLKAERSDWLELTGTLRVRLLQALSGTCATLAQEEFSYLPRQEALMRLQRVQNIALYKHDRIGFWNSFSVNEVDMVSATGPNEDRTMATYAAVSKAAIEAEDGSLDEYSKTQETAQLNAEFQDAHNAYVDAKTAAATTAAAIVGAITSAMIMAFTGGSAAPACAALADALISTTMKELTEAALMGNDYSLEQGATDLAAAFAAGCLGMGLGKAVEGWAESGSAYFVQYASETLDLQLSEGVEVVFTDAFSKALERELVEIPPSYAESLIKEEGLLRENLNGYIEQHQGYMTDIFLDILNSAVQYKTGQWTGLTQEIENLKNNGHWDDLITRLIIKNNIDIATATIITQVIAGKAPDAEGWTTLLCQVASSRMEGYISLQAAKEDAANTLRFFNTASAEELSKMEFVDASTADMIITARGEDGFATVHQIIETDSIKTQVLSPAILKLRDDFLEQKKTLASTNGN